MEFPTQRRRLEDATMNQPKQSQSPNPFIVKAVAIGLCGLAAVCIPNAGVSACLQATIVEVVNVRNLQRLGNKLKEIHQASKSKGKK